MTEKRQRGKCCPLRKITRITSQQKLNHVERVPIIHTDYDDVRSIKAIYLIPLINLVIAGKTGLDMRIKFVWTSVKLGITSPRY